MPTLQHSKFTYQMPIFATPMVLHLDQAWSFPISHWLVEAMLLTLTDVHRAVTPNYLAPGRGFPVTLVFGNFSGWIRLFEVSLFESARSFCWKNVDHMMKQAADSFLNFFRCLVLAYQSMYLRNQARHLFSKIAGVMIFICRFGKSWSQSLL